MLCQAAGALTGLASLGCGLASPAFAQAPQRRPRKSLSAGKRVRTVDLHAHCHVPEANALMGLKVQLQSLVVSPERIKAMDEQGIDIEALSINRSFGPKQSPTSPVRLSSCRTKSSPRSARHSRTGFVGLASVALQHPDLAAEQLEHAVKALGLRGALVAGSVNGEELSDPKFHPFWAKAEELGVLIFIHPQGTRRISVSGRLKGNGVLENVIANPLETTIALSHLIFEGNARCLSGAQDLCCSCRRISAFLCWPLRSGLRDLSRAMHQGAQQETERIPESSSITTRWSSLLKGCAHLIAEVGVSQIVMGTDYPFPWTKTAVDHILTTPGLSDAERVAILGRRRPPPRHQACLDNVEAAMCRGISARIKPGKHQKPSQRTSGRYTRGRWRFAIRVD